MGKQGNDNDSDGDAAVEDKDVDNNNKNDGNNNNNNRCKITGLHSNVAKDSNLQLEVLLSFTMLQITCPLTQHNFPADFSLQQQHFLDHTAA